MSLQFTILMVLYGQPEGRASLQDLKRYVAILMTSGPDWAARMKGLAARAPRPDIFGQSFVTRDRDGWAITEAGKAFLAAIERPIRDQARLLQTDVRPALGAGDPLRQG